MLFNNGPALLVRRYGRFSIVLRVVKWEQHHPFWLEIGIGWRGVFLRSPLGVFNDRQSGLHTWGWAWYGDKILVGRGAVSKPEHVPSIGTMTISVD